MSSATPEGAAVINTGPVIALVAALGSLEILVPGTGPYRGFVDEKANVKVGTDCRDVRV